jgi:single-strand DNA-binding protein
MNVAILTGNLGRDPELKQRNGDSILSFSLGVRTGTRDNPKTMWVDCSMWGKRGEAVAPYLAKGKQVTVQGPVSLDTYTGRDNTQKTSLRLEVKELDLPPRAEGSAGQAAPSSERRERPTAAPAGAPADDMDDDIPF